IEQHPVEGGIGGRPREDSRQNETACFFLPFAAFFLGRRVSFGSLLHQLGALLFERRLPFLESICCHTPLSTPDMGQGVPPLVALVLKIRGAVVQNWFGYTARKHFPAC